MQQTKFAWYVIHEERRGGHLREQTRVMPLPGGAVLQHWEAAAPGNAHTQSIVWVPSLDVRLDAGGKPILIGPRPMMGPGPVL